MRPLSSIFFVRDTITLAKKKNPVMGCRVLCVGGVVKKYGLCNACVLGYMGIFLCMEGKIQVACNERDLLKWWIFIVCVAGKI